MISNSTKFQEILMKTQIAIETLSFEIIDDIEKVEESISKFKNNVSLIRENIENLYAFTFNYLHNEMKKQYVLLIINTMLMRLENKLKLFNYKG